MNTTLRTFLFHRVSPQRDKLWNPITPQLFDRILKYLDSNFEIVPLEQTLLGTYKPVAKKELCAITFDDGYKDYIDHALPILHKYKAPSSMYVVTDCVEKNLPPWTYLINHLFINTSHLALDLQSKALPPQLQKTKWKNQEERIAFARKLSPFLKQLNNHERTLIYNQILKDLDDVDYPEDMMMNWKEIEEISRENCEIGSHSVSHPLLTKKIDHDSLKKEIYDSGKKIEKVIGKFPLAFSYPFGNYNKAIEKMTQEAGYRLGIAVNNTFCKIPSFNPYEVPRIELYDEPFFKSRLRISGVIEKVSRAIKPKKEF